MKKLFCKLLAFTLFAGLQTQATPVLEKTVSSIGLSQTITLSLPSGTQGNDLLVAALMLDRGTQIDVTAPSGWTLLRRSNCSRYLGMATYYRITRASEPQTYAFGLDEETKWAASISRISGADLDKPIDISGRATGKKGNATAPSLTTRSADTLILAFYTNRRNATFTPHAETTEQYDQPNLPEGLPSNMLATFTQSKTGETGDKTATPSRNDRHWIAMQIAVAAGQSAPADLSGVSVSASDTVLGEKSILTLSQACDSDGNALNGAVEARLTSNLTPLTHNQTLLFIGGNAAMSVALAPPGTHSLTLALTGITSPAAASAAISRRPITLAADPGQSKQENSPDPELTGSLIGGSLLDGIPLCGTLSRDSGENVGTYSIRQGSITAAANPSYAITFVPADFQIQQAPPPEAAGIWISAEELADLPMSGEPWRLLKQDADTYWGVPNLSDQEDKSNVYTLSKALVYARTGIESYRDEVIEACMQAIGTETGGRTLALGRNLAAFVIAADLVGLPEEEDALFRSWLRELLTAEMAEGRSLTTCHEERPNNWGTHAGASRAAIAVYLGDLDELDRAAKVFKGYLGDRNSYAGFDYGDLYWQSDPARPVGINPKGATLQGHNVDGVLPDDQRRASEGEFTWPPPKENYVYEALQGALLQAVILYRAGYDVWNWEDHALLRSFTWLYETADFPAEGDDLWQPFIINYYYGTDFPTPETSRSGKNIPRTCWTHAK